MQQFPLLASCWTTAGSAVPHSDDERSPERFIERVRAASDAGFEGMGLLHADVVEIRDTIGLAEMKSVFQEHGIRYLELEMLMNWYEGGEARIRAERVGGDLFAAAAALGATHIKAGCDYSGRNWPPSELARDFRHICERAADAGTKIALEPQPMSTIKTPKEAAELIDAANHEAGGIIVDIWHMEKGGVPFETLHEVPAGLIIGVEINDAQKAVDGTLLQDTINNRCFCGEGEFDLQGFITTIVKAGYRGPWGVEILSRSFRVLPMREAVVRAFETATAQFKKIH